MAAEFWQAYFDKAYGGDYRKRNPAGKLSCCLREIRKTRPSGRLLGSRWKNFSPAILLIGARA